MDLVASKQHSGGLRSSFGGMQVLVALDILRTSLVVISQWSAVKIGEVQQQTQEPPQEECSVVVMLVSSVVVMSCQVGHSGAVEAEVAVCAV